jgi:hypothetical protein
MREIIGNIRGFETTTWKDGKKLRNSLFWHYVKHGFDDMLPDGIASEEDYLELARLLGRLAALGSPGTFVKVRGNGDVAVYVEGRTARGVFMAIASKGSYGMVKTLFSLEEGKSYFDRDDRRLI